MDSGRAQRSWPPQQISNASPGPVASDPESLPDTRSACIGEDNMVGMEHGEQDSLRDREPSSILELLRDVSVG